MSPAGESDPGDLSIFPIFLIVKILDIKLFVMYLDVKRSRVGGRPGGAPGRCA